MFFLRSLIAKISLIIILTEIIILSSMGYYYIERFKKHVDEGIETQIQLPGKLMNRQLLKYESIADREMMREIVGEKFVEGFVFSKKLKIYYSLEEGQIGKSLSEVVKNGLPGFTEDTRDSITERTEENGKSYLICVTPLMAYEEASPFFFSFVKVETSRSEADKQNIVIFFIASSTLCIILTSILIILFMKNLIISPVQKLENSICQIADGNLEQPLENKRRDEIGLLASSFEKMRNSIKDYIRQLKDSEKKYRDIFENAVEGMFQISSDNRFLSANKSLVSILGYGSKDELFDSINDIKGQLYVKGDDFDILLKALIRDGKSIGTETLFKRKNGEIFWASVSARRVFDEKSSMIYYEGSILDITERHRRTHAENERRKAEALTEAKSRFLANMSHEIRTPLNAIIGMCILALKTSLTQKQKDYLEKINSSSKSLLGIINDILDFSKIEAGKLEVESVDFMLEDVFSHVANVAGLGAEEKGLELIIDSDIRIPTVLIGDPLRLGQILINLTTNAIKFTETGEIILSALMEKDEKKGVLIRFSICDSGMGMTEEQTKKLFTSFSQADASTTRRFGGTGLGLAICKRLVELMGGIMNVESSPGKGSTFSFTALFKKGERNEPRAEKIPPNLKGMRILIIDDNAAAREILFETLTSLSFEVEVSSSGLDGIYEIAYWEEKKKPFSLVIIDWKMPLLDGIQTIKKIRNNSNIQSPPKIILMTAYGRENILQLAESEGIEAYLFKPINPSVLLETIMKIFASGKYETEEINKQTLATGAKDNINLTPVAGARILLVEDNDLNQQIATELLEQAGFIVELADNGKKALELFLNSKSFDAVLMDIQMPEMDGYTATMEIRKHEADIFKIDFSDGRTPIIAMTAHALKEEIDKCKDSGMDDYVSKPVDPDILFSVLLKWIKPKTGQIPEGKVFQSFPEEVGLPERIEGIELSFGLRHLAGNSRLYSELLKGFNLKHSGDHEKIQNQIKDEDYDNAAIQTHTLKGISANLGAIAVSEAASLLEKSIRTREKEPITKALSKLDKEIKRVTEAIDNWLKSSELPVDSENQVQLECQEDIEKKEDIPNLFRELQNCLSTYNVKAEHLMSRLTPILCRTNPKDSKELSFLIKNLEYEKAKIILAKLASEINITLESIDS